MRSFTSDILSTTPPRAVKASFLLVLAAWLTMAVTPSYAFASTCSRPCLYLHRKTSRYSWHASERLCYAVPCGPGEGS